ncbi:MAG: alcohol dehydrogenase catalytic domain-containing protein [Candidatus Accumulibacter sp.]|jgi:L-iditol 2-dehydrogenase|nr:alcohol dehydrogenase catalytic domain-containing protein [Accumulibacter sp.]
MKGLVKFAEGPEGLEIRDLEKPAPKPGELLVKVMAAGICGTDLHIMRDEYKYSPPVVLGHEFTGVVEELGEGASGFRPGDQIVCITAVVSCGKCRYCRLGLNMLCNERKSIGSGVNGAMAEYVAVPADLAYIVPENLAGSDVMALAEPLACMVRAVIEQSSVKAGDVALVSGPGAIGQLAAFLARRQGAFVILAGTGGDTERLRLGREFCADATAQGREELEALVARHTKDGVDVAIECAGAAASLDTCIDLVRKRGIVSQAGLFGKKIPVDMDRILMKELRLTVSYATERTSWDIMMRLAAQGRLAGIEKLISARVPLADWRRAFRMAENKEGFKIFLTP